MYSCTVASQSENRTLSARLSAKQHTAWLNHQPIRVNIYLPNWFNYVLPNAIPGLCNFNLSDSSHWQPPLKQTVSSEANLMFMFISNYLLSNRCLLGSCSNSSQRCIRIIATQNQCIPAEIKTAVHKSNGIMNPRLLYWGFFCLFVLFFRVREPKDFISYFDITKNMIVCSILFNILSWMSSVLTCMQHHT